jgi:MerR family mercuric resistance operon transcriptional regulator
MRIGELAARAAVSVQTVRFYERKGLIRQPRRLPSGYREYPAEAVAILQFIKHNQSSGFTLTEIGSILKSISTGSSAALNRREDIQKKISALDDRIQSLQMIRDELSACLDRCQCGDGQSPCPGSVAVAHALTRA